MSRTTIPVWFGTAGYSWPEWVGPFYPPGTTPDRMASFYATQFPCVEINSTFYKPPAPGQLDRLAARTAPGFHFSLKVPRTISHEHRAHDLEPLRKAADELTRAHRLIGFVLQFPEMFRDTHRNREWVERVLGGLYPNPVWVEFRHRSWHRPHLGDWLRGRGGDLAALDVPELPQLFPRAYVDPGTTRLYARLHSRVTENWNGPGKLRYDYDYPEVVLGEWLNILRAAAPRLTEAHLMFNNCQGIQAVQNARRMADLIRAEGPEFHVVEPPAPAPPRQGTLFD